MDNNTLEKNIEHCINACEQAINACQELTSVCGGTEMIECAEYVGKAVHACDNAIKACQDCIAACSAHKNELVDQSSLQALADSCHIALQTSLTCIRTCKTEDADSCCDISMQCINAYEQCAMQGQLVLDQLKK